MAASSSKKRKLDDRDDHGDDILDPAFDIVEELKRDPLFGYRICERQKDSKGIKNVEDILEQAHGIVRSQRVLRSSNDVKAVLQDFRPAPKVPANDDDDDDDEDDEETKEYESAIRVVKSIALISWDESNDSKTSSGSGFGSGDGHQVTSRVVNATFNIRSAHDFVISISFSSAWDYDSYHSNGSSSISITGPDDLDLYTIDDDFACAFDSSPVIDSSRGSCSWEAIDSVLDALGIDIKRSTFMRVLSTCIEVLLKDRLVNTDQIPVVQGGELSELVDDALDGIDGEDADAAAAAAVAAAARDDQRRVGTDDEDADDDDEDDDDQ